MGKLPKVVERIVSACHGTTASFRVARAQSAHDCLFEDPPVFNWLHQVDVYD